MLDDIASRRTFLQAAGSAGALWLLAEAALAREALAHAVRQRALPAPRFETLRADQAAGLETVAMRIFPSDGTPGAKEAGVIHFIDRALSTFAANQKALLEEGIADLDRRAAAKWPGTSSFATLPAERQDELLREIEATPFFQALRFLTIAGMFSLPDWGGNAENTGWTLLGQDHQPFYQPPFGWYDANESGRR
jgi:gluconate 2-dehydrogenase gamma chain